MSVFLQDLVMKRESKSYTDSVYAILTAANLFQGPKYLLSGLTGMAFKFSVHQQLLPMSVSAYGQWGNEHKPAIDNLGILTIFDAGRVRHHTFPYYQQEAVNAVKSSLDCGIGVVYWIPEFGVIHGYDDGDRVFYIQDGCSEESQIVLYDNFGLNFTTFWYYQVFGDKVDIARQDMILESLRLAILDWETPFRTLPNTDIASGKLAYVYLCQGLKQGSFNTHGAVYILDSYMTARTEIRDYLGDAQGIWTELDEAYQLYGLLAAMIPRMNDCIRAHRGERQVDLSRVDELIELLTQAELLEDQAISHFRHISARYPDLKRTTIPRWGSHTPR
ncbi:hypothetical protein BVG16_21770 [Paenibacillus selenitireducens]|uniref:BtrH N-terminal domain-containing protein n=1 Tax=Paenibacillus selenitireducens TaxID=1324314 RepID=A0A1T2X5W9_9BACL|nr:hypothetical protein [Paenibacillus selenitireducens]OPA75230.1 hypothetical protein BVG16_21770 [Paenibacillus selenitireducens]